MKYEIYWSYPGAEHSVETTSKDRALTICKEVQSDLDENTKYRLSLYGEGELMGQVTSKREISHTKTGCFK